MKRIDILQNITELEKSLTKLDNSQLSKIRNITRTIKTRLYYLINVYDDIDNLIHDIKSFENLTD